MSPAGSGSASVSGVEVRWEPPTVTPSRRQSAIEGLSPAERRRWAMMTHPAGRDQFLLGRLILREMAAEMLGLPLDRVTTSARCTRCGGNHGRPMIVATETAVAMPHASLTYTSELIVGAIARASVASAIGIDAETAPATRERITAIDELVPTAARSWRRNDSLRRWTRMEAVLKADGRGLRVDPREVRLRKHVGGFVATVGDDATTYDVIDLRVERRTIASLATARPVSEPRPPAGSE